jgi:mono/diheme cytochrome c family protein
MHDAQRTSRSLDSRSEKFVPHRSGAGFQPAVLCTVTVFLASAAGALIAGQAKPPGRTVWDGVYTDAQAERATQVFGQSCANCHTLTSQESNNKPLAGPKFWEGFTQKTVGDLLTYVKTSMPNGNGGSLAAATYNDLVALILKSNGFPAGTTDLAPEIVADVQIIPKEGPGELPSNTLVRVVGCLSKSGSDWLLTSATTPERIERATVGPADASRPLGNRTVTLKFVLTRLDSFVGQRISVSGILMGAGGVDGINVTTVSRAAETCP